VTLPPNGDPDVVTGGRVGPAPPEPIARVTRRARARQNAAGPDR
jgi:hypothetical protein